MSTDMKNEARVFGDGDITICVNQVSGAARIYAGTRQIGMIQHLKLDLDPKQVIPQLEIAFPQSHDKDLSLKIEEQVRALRQHAPWVKITR